MSQGSPRPAREARALTWVFARRPADANLVLMDPESFEQRTVPRSVLGDQAAFLVEGTTIHLSFASDDGDVLAGARPALESQLIHSLLVIVDLTMLPLCRPAATDRDFRGE